MYKRDFFQKIFKSESVHVDSLLPYIIKTDIILCYDPRSKKFVSPCDKLLQIPVGEIKYAPNDGNKWYVLTIGTHNIMTRNTKSPTGMLGLHMRHLEKIGYKPHLVS